MDLKKGVRSLSPLIIHFLIFLALTQTFLIYGFLIVIGVFFSLIAWGIVCFFIRLSLGMYHSLKKPCQWCADHIPLVGWIWNRLPYLGEDFFRVEVDPTWQKERKSVGNLVKKSFSFFFAILGIQVWISIRTGMISPINLSAFMNWGILLLFLVPLLFYHIWGFNTVGVSFYSEKPLQISSLGGNLNKTILKVSFTSCVLFIFSKYSTGTLLSLQKLLINIFLFLMLFFPIIYTQVLLFFLVFQERDLLGSLKTLKTTLDPRNITELTEDNENPKS